MSGSMSPVPHTALANSPSNEAITTPSSPPHSSPGRRRCRRRQQQQPPPPGYLYGGAVCRIDFWARMTSALGVTQLAIGAGCVLFYMVVMYIHSSSPTPASATSFLGAVPLLHLAAVGLTTGVVIMAAGVIGTVASKKKTKCMVCAFLGLSILSGICAMFPLVIGIQQAAAQQNTNLLLPICELVFGTVEMVVATWSVGVCCQAMCCPNITFGHVSTRPVSGCGGAGGGAGGGGITHFLVSGDGRHVVMLAPQPPTDSSNSNNQPPPPPYAYSLPAHHAPYVLQNGLTVLPLVSWPRVTGGAIVTDSSNHSPDKATQTLAQDAHADFSIEDEQVALLE